MKWIRPLLFLARKTPYQSPAPPHTSSSADIHSQSFPPWPYFYCSLGVFCVFVFPRFVLSVQADLTWPFKKQQFTILVVLQHHCAYWLIDWLLFLSVFLLEGTRNEERPKNTDARNRCLLIVFGHIEGLQSIPFFFLLIHHPCLHSCYFYSFYCWHNPTICSS